MQLTPEQAIFLQQYQLGGYDAEERATKAVVAAVPASQQGYKPHEKSRAAGELAWHILAAEIWFLDGIASGDFTTPEATQPETIDTPEKMLTWYGENRSRALARVRAMTPEQLSKPADFFGIFNWPVVMYLQFMTAHTIHHRGQLSAYLRPMGAKVPDIYGGSADVPFQAAAQA